MRLFLQLVDAGVVSTRDIGKVVEALYGENPPPIMMIGHSMGGAIAVHTAAAKHVPSLLGLCVIDVVEGDYSTCFFVLSHDRDLSFDDQTSSSWGADKREN